MDILIPSFNLLTVIGCRRPRKWSTKATKMAYKFYTVFVFLLVHTFSFTQIMDVILNVRNTDELTHSIYMLLASFLSCFKIITLLSRRKDIGTLTLSLRKSPCKPMDTREDEIMKKYDRSIGSLVTHYTILVEGTVLCMILTSVLTDLRDRKLPYRAWLPYNYPVSWTYYVIYIHQILALIATSLLNIACDCIICGLLVHICGQIEIFKYRLTNIKMAVKEELKKCVRHHNLIYSYASIINDRFKAIICVQFLISTLVICVNLYKLTNTPLNSKYLEFVLYMACMMAQIFFYCWNANRLKLKSAEITYAIFSMDWVTLDKNTKKDLITIMRRSIEPIEIISAYVVSVDLDSFVKILKLSYSAYNFLQRHKQTQ